MQQRKASHLIALRRLAIGLTTGLALGTATASQAAVVNINQPDFDRWNYPFNATPGSRSAASTFGAVGSQPNFDNRDGQYIVGFDTASKAVPTGRDASDYQIRSLTVTATHSTGSFKYDPSYDKYTTYLESSNPDATADPDTGRPIVLTAAGLRGGYTDYGFETAVAGTPTYQEGESFGSNGPTPGPDSEDRSAFAAAFDDSGNLVDISNNVVDGFDFEPWAVGQSTSGLSAGDAVPEATAGQSPGETFSFDVDLTDASIEQYLQEGLSDGGLFFTLSSLHETVQGGSSNPNFYTSDDFDPAAVAPTLELQYEIVPEPTSLAALLAVGGGLLLTGRNRRKQ